jgi:ATP-dependent DNA helicase RecG
MKNWSWLKTQKEGQFFERKSCYDRSAGRSKLRDVRSLSKDLIEFLSAMANADGGMVALGMEDDGTPTGSDYPQDRLDVILKAPQRLAKPPLKSHLAQSSMWSSEHGSRRR